MYLKRMYAPAVEGEARKCSHIKVLRANAGWHVSPRLVERGAAEGWLSLVDGKVVVKTATDEADLVYAIKRAPGHYCCECERALDDEHSARRHVLEEHAGMNAKKLPADNDALRKDFGRLLKMHDFQSADAQNPAGYCRINYYDCVQQEG